MGNQRPSHFNADASIFRNAKALRKESTSAEKLFWEIVKSRKLKGLKFRRQHPLRFYVADFYCHEAQLVIELDGNIHDIEEVKLKDKEREEVIKEFGLTIMRFTNDEVFTELDKVVEKVEKFLGEKNNLLDEVNALPSDTYAQAAERGHYN